MRLPAPLPVAALSNIFIQAIEMSCSHTDQPITTLSPKRFYTDRQALMYATSTRPTKPSSVFERAASRRSNDFSTSEISMVQQKKKKTQTKKKQKNNAFRARA